MAVGSLESLSYDPNNQGLFLLPTWIMGFSWICQEAAKSSFSFAKIMAGQPTPP